MIDHHTEPRLDRENEERGRAATPLLRRHGDEKYPSSKLLAPPAEWTGLRVEHRRIGPGAQNCVAASCTELVCVLSGQTRIKRTGDGQAQEWLARPGTSWLVPAETREAHLELDGSAECLLILMPATLIEPGALVGYDLDPRRLRLAYVGGVIDGALAHYAATLRGLLGRQGRAVDRMMADATRTGLAAHLIDNYSIERWCPPVRAPTMDPARLQRVLDFIESRLAENLSLEDLAARACLSPFHFSRLFNDATGLSPHRYVVKRRVQLAQEMLASGRATLAEIALDAGFGSQANFTRVFRKATGQTPGQYRRAHSPARSTETAATAAHAEEGGDASDLPMQVGEGETPSVFPSWRRATMRLLYCLAGTHQIHPWAAIWI